MPARLRPRRAPGDTSSGRARPVGCPGSCLRARLELAEAHARDGMPSDASRALHAQMRWRVRSSAWFAVVRLWEHDATRGACRGSRRPRRGRSSGPALPRRRCRARRVMRPRSWSSTTTADAGEPRDPAHARQREDEREHDPEARRRPDESHRRTSARADSARRLPAARSRADCRARSGRRGAARPEDVLELVEVVAPQHGSAGCPVEVQRLPGAKLPQLDRWPVRMRPSTSPARTTVMPPGRAHARATTNPAPRASRAGLRSARATTRSGAARQAERPRAPQVRDSRVCAERTDGASERHDDGRDAQAAR